MFNFTQYRGFSFHTFHIVLAVFPLTVLMAMGCTSYASMQSRDIGLFTST